ncbi:MarR family winged helix-turn-helix transcriptional regulator [Taklimakanibacter deserti]|uniref:MarR family winged helix-turn-helix transcriptional regulator n=1 Tax=Taklimakanibacter deserti TaxID=2267839 RepID=UPI000E659780
MVKFPLSPLPERLHDGLERLASLHRLEERQASGPHGLNPTQLAILRLLQRRKTGFRVKTIARELGLTQPTITDSLLALERKTLIARLSDPQDGRALLIHPTEAGRAALATVQGQMSFMQTALAGLSRKEQAALLHIMIKMIRALLQDQAMPVQRMCVTCRHFRPEAAPGTAKPHFCEFVRAHFGSADMQVDCGDHDAASPDHQAATWRKFIGEMPGSGQNHHEETIE